MKKIKNNEQILQGKQEEWESENDSEYYSDFLTDEEIVWKKKKMNNCFLIFFGVMVKE